MCACQARPLPAQHQHHQQRQRQHLLGSEALEASKPLLSLRPLQRHLPVLQQPLRLHLGASALGQPVQPNPQQLLQVSSSINSHHPQAEPGGAIMQGACPSVLMPGLPLPVDALQAQHSQEHCGSLASRTAAGERRSLSGQHDS